MERRVRLKKTRGEEERIEGCGDRKEEEEMERGLEKKKGKKKRKRK